MTALLDAVVGIVSLTGLAQHAWAGKTHFRSESTPAGAVAVVIMALSMGLWYLYLTFTGSHPAVAQATGASIELAALVLFRSAIRASREAGLHPVFDTCGSRRVVTSGPYRYARHPFYLSYILFWTGWAVAVWDGAALAPLAIVTTVYVAAARVEERQLASTPLAREYRGYREQAGFFWPNLRGMFNRS